MRHRNFKRLAAFAALLLALFAGETSLQAQTLQIDSATANWIEGFADFVRWEGEANAEVITIGIIGAPEVANYLNRRAQERASAPRIQVSILNPDDSLDGIDIVYVGSSNRTHWKTIFSKCKSSSTLSIGSQDGFAEAGGCVEFVVRRNRLRFYIAIENTQQCGIEISSKLMELAMEPSGR